MILIFAASTTIDLDALNALVQQYDVAADDAERERVAAEISKLVGGRARGMIRQRLQGMQISPDELNSLADSAIRSALGGVGRSRIKRTDIVVESLLDQMHATSVGRRLWNLLSEDLRRDLVASASFIRAPLAQRLTDSINHLLDRPDLAELLGIGGPAPSGSAIQRTRDNAAMLVAALPSISPIEDRPVHFLGYLKEYSVPMVARNVVQERGKMSDNDLRTWNMLAPVIQDMQASQGQNLTPEQVHAELRRRSAAQYGETIQQIEEAIRSVQPGNAFKIKDYRAYGDARTILISNGISKEEFSEGGNYYVPKSALKMPGLPTIKRLMETMGQGISRPANVPAEHLPAAPSGGDQGAVDAPSWAREVGQQQGRGRDLYRAIVQSLYPDPESAERQIGELLAENASDETIESYIRKVELQDPDLADYLRSSWHAIARQIDSRVTEALSDPSIVGPIARQFGFSPSQLNAQRDGIRRQVFARNTERILRRSI